MGTHSTGAQGNPPEIRAPRRRKIYITDTKLYLPVVTLNSK